jgi:hypothetical protein
MTKAKIGDQRFKKKSYLPHIVAALSVLFVIVGSIFALSSIFRAEDISLQAQFRSAPQSTPDYVSAAEYLWQHPTRNPDYVIFTLTESIIPQERQICFELQTGRNAVNKPGPVLTWIEVDTKLVSNFDMEWDQSYCLQPNFEKGYHLIRLQAVQFAQWGVLVE